MLLTVDVGNSETVFGIWKGASLLGRVRTPTITDHTGEDFIDFWKSEEKIESAVISSVAPHMETKIKKVFQKEGIGDILNVDLNLNYPFEIDKKRFATIGADRLANLCCAVDYGKNVIVADFGTAVTFCLMTGGEYRGGVIMPGIHTGLAALTQKAAKLPNIIFRHKTGIMGEGTKESIECGTYYAAKGMVRETLHELKKITGSFQDYTILATGGIASSLGFTHEFFDIVDPDLTLKGLWRLYYLNKAGKR